MLESPHPVASPHLPQISPYAFERFPVSPVVITCNSEDKISAFAFPRGLHSDRETPRDLLQLLAFTWESPGQHYSFA
jgi:hypothetical protein